MRFPEERVIASSRNVHLYSFVLSPSYLEINQLSSRKSTLFDVRNPNLLFLRTTLP